MTNLAVEQNELDGATIAARPTSRTRWFVPVLAFVVIAAVLWCVALYSSTHLLRDELYPRPEHFTGGSWFESWVRWDAYWYRTIVREGYVYYPGVQSSVAFFPGYPVVVGLLSALFPSVFITGVVTTLASGLAASVLFYRWCAMRLSPSAAATALLVLLVYPYAWYLYGPVYADAFCLAMTLAAFLAVEKDHLWLAGVFGFAASASRPVGLIVAFALLLRVIEMRNTAHGLGRPFARLAPRWTWLTSARRRFSWRGLHRSDLPIFMAFGGFASYCVYLWVRFGDPFLFSTVQSSPGWDQPDGPSTWFKVGLLGELFSHPSVYTLGKILQGMAALGVLLLMGRIARRFGWAYAVLAAGVALLPIIWTKDFVGTGRYLLLAFPAFAVVGDWLTERTRLRAAVLAGCGLTLVILTAHFARGSYLS